MEERIKKLEEKMAELEMRIQEQPKVLKCNLKLDISDSNPDDLIEKYRQCLQVRNSSIAIK